MPLLATDILSANLEALSRASADAAARIRAATVREDVEFVGTLDGVPTARLGGGPGARLLASARRPLDESKRLMDAIDIKEAAVYVVAGFGMGYHVAELARRVGRSGVIIVFEPDVALLRTVLGRVDHSTWIKSGNICILTDPDDGAAMSTCLRGLEGLVGLGVTLVQHPPSAARLGDGVSRFHERFTGIVESVKMTVITTLVQVRVTMRNLLQNADAYALRPGVADLAGACAGRAAIVVSAGPSLQRNVHLLEDPRVRQRCVIVAAQTVLKPLLARGIRPHFVTALDFSEINRRFYEGLTAEQVKGITLVVEPKVNPSVLMAWPGEARCVGDGTLDLLLGDGLSRPHGTLKQGATVAHLAYYLARHLGCNPVALIGQDLGFTDGQYYAAGASIHNVWACEINPFKSLELMEWQRIVRMGPHLRKATDALGRPCYTDEQMHSYQMQFEADFREDAARGLTTIDATEGGVRKQGAGAATLREFLDRHIKPSGPSIDDLLPRASIGLPAPARTIAALKTRVSDARRQVGRIADLSRKTAAMLTEMREHQDDRERVDRLITKVQAHGREAEALRPGFPLTQLLGQATVFNRVRADRLISLEKGLSDLEHQSLQITRDIENVQGLARTADELADMLDGCAAMLGGAPKITRDMPVNEAELDRPRSEAPAPVRSVVVSAIVPVDLAAGGLGWARSLDGTFAGHPSVLAATVDRLLGCKELRDITLVSDDEARVRTLLSGRQNADSRVRVAPPAAKADVRRRRTIAVGRLWARACWRGGLGDLTIFDEVFDPRACAATMQAIGADAALIVGPDWAALDPALCDQIIRRHRENPQQHRLTFTQAVPGLCGCVIARSLAEDLSRGDDWPRLVFASIGGVLGYVPMAPLQDLIAHPICPGLSGPVRDCGLRLIADTPLMRFALAEALNSNPDETATIIERVQEYLRGRDTAEELVIDGDRANLTGLLCEFGAPGAGRTITFGDGAWDPMSCPPIFDWIAAARKAGLAGVHVRTSLRDVNERTMEQLLASQIDVISVDCSDQHGRSLEEGQARVERLMELRTARLGHDGMDVPWIVPRLTRRDVTYGMVEEFVNRWVIRCGWAALDPLREARPTERIAPLPLPAAAAQRLTGARGGA